MNAIIIKVNEKVIGVSKICDIPQKQFIELSKDVAKLWANKDEQIKALKGEVLSLSEKLEEHEHKIADLYYQIAVDRGEEE